MALRPWNVFKKTYYVSHAGGASLPVASQLSLARARLQTEEAGAGGIGGSFVGRLGLLLPPAAAMWLLLLAARWRYQDPEKMRALDASSSVGGSVLRDFLGWRVAAHLGPYQVPNLVRARLHQEPLQTLRQPLLLDHERSRALARLEQLSQRRLAAQSLAPLGGLEPLFLDALALPGPARGTAPGSTESHRAAALRVVLDVVGALPPEGREVPPWVLSGLVAAGGEPWGTAQGQELQATLLCQLLRSAANCRAAAALPEVLAYLSQPGMKRKEETWWPVKAYLLSGETPDLLRRGLRLVARECPDAVVVQG
ncbi:unnamed protein product [Prorocentrum cordatum]|uniref:HEAT repeat-containing protein 1 n=1 Tax=Prorocentrum cordatum TaxID=2364126 RepID=A0ABN9R943_9DINO|nr:unnamed protein product [Polarella glacialis]